MDLYVSNLGDQITDESLGAIFATYGTVISATIMRNRDTGVSGGFGFIDMPNDREAQNAIQRLNGTVINGKNVSVVEAGIHRKELSGKV